MKIKCANCGQKTISFKKAHFSTRIFNCPNCYSSLKADRHNVLYWFLFLINFLVWMLLTKFFIRNGINRYLSLPLILGMVFLILHVSTYTIINDNKIEKLNIKEFFYTFVIIYPLLLILMMIFKF